MIDWEALESRLARLARTAKPGHLLSLALPLASFPAGLPDEGKWFHWQRPDEGLTLTGLGAALRLSATGPARFSHLGAAHRLILKQWIRDGEDFKPLAWCGFAFSPEAEGPLPNACLVIPAVLLVKEGEDCRAIFSTVAAEADQALPGWRNLWQQLATRPQAPARISRRPTPLVDQAFLARGQAALGAIGRGAFRKLVLTRSAAFRSDEPIAAATMVKSLAARNPSCAIWAVGQDEHVFLGASPERLLGVKGCRVQADALAGTSWESAALSLQADKNRHEHRLVAEGVTEALAPLCHALEVPSGAEVLHMGGLQHLRQRVVGFPREGVGAFELLDRLHPTPAVNGTPTPDALAWLEAHRDRREAWYTGGIGWLDAAGDADLAVALRCGLMRGRDITLYAGAGFVAGSIPEQELAETEAKFGAMLAALAGDEHEHIPMTGTTR